MEVISTYFPRLLRNNTTATIMRISSKKSKMTGNLTHLPLLPSWETIRNLRNEFLFDTSMLS